MAANTLAPSGFHDIRLWSSGPPNYAYSYGDIAYNYSSQIAYGDPVKLTSDGLITLFAKGDTTIHGIAYGVDYFDPNNILGGQFHPAWTYPTLASTAKPRIKMVIDPNMLFIAQMRGTAFTQTDIGLNVDIYSGTSGVPVSGSGLSTCALDATTAATATLPFRVVGIVGLTAGFEGVAISRDYVPTYDNQWVVVKLNASDMTNTTGA